MSESERKDFVLNVEDDLTAQSDAKEEEKEETTRSEALKLVENGLRDAADVPAVVVGNAGDAMDEDGDSEAETLIQSPEKKRNSVADGSKTMQHVSMARSDAGSIILTNTSDKENTTRKRKRSRERGSHDSASDTSSRHSSPLSSPLVHPQSDVGSDLNAASDTESSPKQSNKSDVQDSIDSLKKRRRRPSEIVPPSLSRRRSKRSSVDLLERRETRSATYPRPSDDEKSASPEPISSKEHRRGASTQLTTGEFERKKRGRPPLINTRRNRSADRVSNSSGESEPRTGRARPLIHKFASNDHDTMSPAKVGPRKWKDKNGRTYLARACANCDIEAATAKLIERPEDLNMEDNAGNTPLQIAALEGFEEIVEFLLSKGAEVNVRNVDKDTPLIDAVENGHVEVIKLLLKYGANPRMGNAKGDEPYELVHPDDEAYSQIREMLAEAKDKDTKKTPGIDAFDSQAREGQTSRAASAASPRDSPPIGAPRSPPALGSRRRTGRSESTRNDLLWQANTQENLAKLAGKGDVQGVANILSILEKAETESLIAAAKAGHEEVLQLLIAMGRPDPDPEPVRSSKMVPGYNTPMLAAIGRGHPDVVKLLANQSGFNPCRRYKEKTYYDLAEDRRGNRWEEEFNVLRAAYDRAKGRKTSSPRKTREGERTRPRRSSSSVTEAKRQMPSPTQTHRSLPVQAPDSSPRERRKISDPDRLKAKIDMEYTVAVTSDVDQTVDAPAKTHRTRRSQSDLPPVPALESEPSQKRRRLVTGKEHRSRHTVSTSSDNEDSEMINDEREDRPQLALKRSRVSSTPEPPGGNKERKKRRTVLESSPDDMRPRMNNPTESATIPPISAAEPEVKPSDDQNTSTDVNMSSLQRSRSNSAQAVQANEVKEEPSPTHNDPIPTDIEALPDAAEESDDHYSPPPAVEPTYEEREAERRAKESADRAATEEAARQEIQRRAEEERIAQEKLAEEERLRQEAELRRKQEEVDARRRQEEERQERARREQESRRRLELFERERKRLDGLPVVLAKTARMVDDGDSEVRSPQWLSKFLPLYCVKTYQLDHNCDSSIAEESWVPNFQIAGLLGTKDLNLSEFNSFEKRHVTPHERQCIWRVARLKLSYDFNPLWTTSVSKANEIEHIAQEKFMSMAELFWVKLSNFLDQLPRFPHLQRNLPRQTISLKSYHEILGTSTKIGLLQQYDNLPNGISTHIHTNGENGIT
ncbi:hypothetical protein LTR64_003893 [Lithohypha guttulata]|uniref:uncharacterized protein n=1 Tax=Lithohypha guttulata TaxID=1690604 RepID=UPI002DDF18F4|nr:hypothetical protein LTR51_006931 [Lithohypha guttulata]